MIRKLVMKKTEEQLLAEMAPLQAELRKRRDEKALAEARALVGKCFKYRNCYSCPQEESDYWWLYSKVTGVGDYSARAFRFQTDKYGKTEVEWNVRQPSTGGYIEISAKEFNAAWREVQRRVARMKP